MSGELQFVAADGTSYWFGRDDRFPDEVRIYGPDPNRWRYLPADEARKIVSEALDDGGEVQQGDPVLFFQEEEGHSVG